MASKRLCILHVGECVSSQPNNEIKSFTEEVWSKVTFAKSVRQSKQFSTESKYSEVCLKLPDRYIEHHGYHTDCYKNFTAVSKYSKSETTPSEEKTKSVFLRSDKETFHNSLDVCLFCKQRQRRSKGSREAPIVCKNHETLSKIRDAANVLEDSTILNILNCSGFSNDNVQYHQSCKKKYILKAQLKITADDVPVSSVSAGRLACAKSFQEIADYIECNIISNNNSELLKSLYERYKVILQENHDQDVCSNAYNFGQKLLHYFDGRIKMDKLSNKQGNVVYPHNMDFNLAIELAFSEFNTVTQAAFLLRKVILEAKNSSTDFPYPLTADSLAQHETARPELLSSFFQTLITGSNKTSTPRVQRYIDSLCDDCLFTCTKGLIKPSKHVYLGLGLKSMTGSKKVIEILNHFGHCLHYNSIEELETDVAKSIEEKNRFTPSELLCKEDLCTGVAWDNYDHNTETLSGKGTLHDTVGICYQNILTPDQYNKNHQSDIQSTTKRPRKRSLSSDNSNNIEPYRKKPKLSRFDYISKAHVVPANLYQCLHRDQLWTVASKLYPQTPMWKGWNSLVSEDKLPLQKIGYMENISLPPTRLDVVAETLRISQSVAKECHQQYAVVHYDLAIAKPAKQIQLAESPTYDDVFICFGPFHIQLAYFASLGYIIEESGISDILTDCGVLASGSLNGFLHGKHYNRCKRIHTLIFQAFRHLHLSSFFNQSILPEDACTTIQQFCENPSPQELKILENSEEFNEFMLRYDAYLQHTRSGCQGKTAQFWIQYTDLVQLYLLFSRACHTNDIDLFIYCIREMTAIFFATNRPNYARWMVRFHLDLLNMDKTHPGIREILEKGALTIRRTNKPFSRAPVDLTLEQTINADAASRPSGITHFSSSVSTRKRWMITHAARTAIIGELLQRAGLQRVEETCQETKIARVKRDNSDLTALIQNIENTFNPFSEDNVDEDLYSISTGKSVPRIISEDLTSLQEKGKQWMEEFTADCFADPSRFEKPITRRKVKNFSQIGVKSKFELKDKQVRELTCSRDLFGRLLFLAAEMNMDLRYVFKFPLTPVPLSLAHIDGSLLKTDKSALLKKMESKAINIPPQMIDVTIVDAMYFIQSLTNWPVTFGGIAKLILSILTKTSSTVHFVADCYNNSSIKDMEHSNRGLGYNIKITGSEQRRPQDMHKALKSSSFKKCFLLFLKNEWCKDTYSLTLGNCRVFFGLEEQCFVYENVANKLVCREITSLKCTHEEADTRIVLHLRFCVKEGCKALTVRSSDTDVLVILLYHVQTFPTTTVHMDVGNDSNNNRRYINVSELCYNLGAPVCDALPGFHAFTGCDYTAAFHRKGKVKPLEILLQSQRFRDAFSQLGTSDHVESQIFSDLSAFVCSLYGQPMCEDVNEARFFLFKKRFGPSSSSKPLANLKGTDPSSLPPSETVLRQKVLRSNYVAYMWKHADLCNPVHMDPTSSGWESGPNGYTIRWFEGDQMPATICPRATEEDEDDDDDDNMSLSYESDSLDEDDSDTQTSE